MTCIIGLEHEGKVYMGGDSAGVNPYDHSLTTRADEKVFRNGEFIIGFTSSFRMGQLLRYRFKPPIHHSEIDIDTYMITEFIEAVRECLKRGGYNETEKGADRGGSFLVGYRGCLYTIYGDYQVARNTFPFSAVGCGEHFAMGSMNMTEGKDPEDRIRLALETAERFSGGVRSPFVILSEEGSLAKVS